MEDDTDYTTQMMQMMKQQTAAATPWTTTTAYPGHLIDQVARLTEELRRAQAGLTSDKFNGVHDADLVLELIARGYVVHKPLPEE